MGVRGGRWEKPREVGYWSWSLGMPRRRRERVVVRVRRRGLRGRGARERMVRTLRRRRWGVEGVVVEVQWRSARVAPERKRKRSQFVR